MATWTSEFCPHFIIFHRTHITPISSSLHWQMFVVPCEVRPVGWWKGFVFPVGLYVVAALFPLLLGPLTNVSLKCQSDNFEPQEMRWIKFFIIEGPRDGKIAFLSISTSICHWNKCWSYSQICLHIPCLSLVLWLVSGCSHIHARNYLLLEDDAYLSTHLYFICLSILLLSSHP